MNKNKRPAPNDWRRQRQEQYLRGVVLVFKDYHPHRIRWEHDHCEFCGSKFSLNEGDLKKGYSTLDECYWICCECFNDFKDEFSWQVEV